MCDEREEETPWYNVVAAFLAVGPALWAIGLLFHLRPIERAMESWWTLPWIATVLILGVVTWILCGGLFSVILKKFDAEEQEDVE